MVSPWEATIRLPHNSHHSAFRGPCSHMHLSGVHPYPKDRLVKDEVCSRKEQIFMSLYRIGNVLV
jgi:hypothetical protein